ncbi:MAG TPA: hypothetical protein PK834_13340 [Thauera aminoaromatica]|nr:hypothetical protein [Thauera aminoaromatica]
MRGGLARLASGLRAQARRRLLIVLALLSLLFSVLGYFTNPVSLPAMCRIYG